MLADVAEGDDVPVGPDASTGLLPHLDQDVRRLLKRVVERDGLATVRSLTFAITICGNGEDDVDVAEVVVEVAVVWLVDEPSSSTWWSLSLLAEFPKKPSK